MGKELVDSYPSLKRAAFFYISNSCQSPQIPNADFPCRIQLGQSHLAEKAALTCCLLGRYKAIQGPRWWLHRGLHRSQGWSVVKEWTHQSVLVAARCFFQAGRPYCGRLSEECHWAQQCPSLDSLLSLAAFDGGLSWQPSGQIKHGAGGWGVRQASLPFPNEASGEFSGKGSDVDHKLTGKSDSEYKWLPIA